MRGWREARSASRAALLFVALAAVGCGGEDPAEESSEESSEARPTSPSRVRGGRLGASAAAHAAEGHAEASEPAAASPRPRTSVLAARLEEEDEAERSAARAPEPEAEAEAPAPEEPEARDLTAELRESFRLPHDCFTYARVESFGTSLTVSVRVTVMPSGRVTRAAVTASALTPDEIACVERSAMDVPFRAPVDGAPRTVSATIEFEVATTPAEAPDPAH